MTRHHRRRSAVADIRHRLRQGLQPHLANIVKENNKPLTEFPRFMDLPLELRRQIYRRFLLENCLALDITNNSCLALVMEDHTIHIELLFRHDDTSGSPYGYTCIPAYFICKSKLCEAERYELFCKRGDPQTEILHPRDRHELSHLHRRCQYGIPTTRRLDLSLARVSKETHREAMKMFYTRSTFSFDKASDIGPWLAAIPEGMKSLVRSLHFEMTLGTSFFLLHANLYSITIRSLPAHYEPHANLPPRQQSTTSSAQPSR